MASLGLRELLAGALIAAAIAAPASAATPSTGLKSCALGRIPPALRAALPKRIASERDRYATTVRSLSSGDRSRATSAFTAGLGAYLYGMPTVVTRQTTLTYPKNRLVGVAQLATPDSKSVVSPNHDTLYSVSQVDLTAGPIVIAAPDTGGRYSVIQLLDGFSNVVDYVGASGAAETVVLVPPGYSGSTPAGARVIKSPTSLVWALGRTLVDGPDDVAAAKAVMTGYSLTPLAAYNQGTRVREAVLDNSLGPRPKIVPPSGLAFFDALGTALGADPPLKADACALKVFAAAGIGPNTTPSKGTDPVVAAALVAAERAGNKIVDASVKVIRRAGQKANNGWNLQIADIGRFGTDYALRAVTARVGLAANTPDEAIYPHADTDVTGRALSGANRYVVTFPAGQLPRSAPSGR